MTAKDYAVKCHNETNHQYDGKPYDVHLQMVVDNFHKFKHLLTLKTPENLQIVEDACWCHDVIEDCRQTYNDVKKATNENVANIVYTLTNEKGKTRKERANEKYYEGIRNIRCADFVKLCDRIANIEYSKQNKSKMYQMYIDEMDDFLTKLQPEFHYNEMVSYLKSL